MSLLVNGYLIYDDSGSELFATNDLQKQHSMRLVICAWKNFNVCRNVHHPKHPPPEEAD